MRITVKQFKGLIKEAMEEMQSTLSTRSEKDDLFSTYSDMYKEMYNIRPRWLKYDEVSEDELRAMIEELEKHYSEEVDARKEEDKEAEEYYSQLQREREAAEKEKAELAAHGAPEGHEHLEDLPMRSGMGKRLAESIKKVVREALKEEEKTKVKGDQDELDVAPPFGELDKHDFEKLGKMSKAKADKKD